MSSCGCPFFIPFSCCLLFLFTCGCRCRVLFSRWLLSLLLGIRQFTFSHLTIRLFCISLVFAPSTRSLVPLLSFVSVFLDLVLLLYCFLSVWLLFFILFSCFSVFHCICLSVFIPHISFGYCFLSLRQISRECLALLYAWNLLLRKSCNYPFLVLCIECKRVILHPEYVHIISLPSFALPSPVVRLFVHIKHFLVSVLFTSNCAIYTLYHCSKHCLHTPRSPLLLTLLFTSFTHTLTHLVYSHFYSPRLLTL